MEPMTDDELMHYGMPRRSGRYPWGSGKDPYQHSGDFLSRVKDLQDQGLSEADIAKNIGLTSTQLRIQIAVAKNEQRGLLVDRAKSLKEDGLSTSEIGRKMGVNESTVRSWFNAESEGRMKRAVETADKLEQLINERGMLDVGADVERDLNISRNKLDEALFTLETRGYPIYKGRIQQATNKGNFTTMTVLCPKGTEYKEIYNTENIHSVSDVTSHDGGKTFDSFVYPKSMDSSRLQIRYKEDGGIDKDGVIELRRGVKDLSLGDSSYSQVRILVDGNKYLKGMAVYSDDMPDGVDVIFNTNKSKSVAKMDVLKDIKKDDPKNPFGSYIKANGQSYYIDDNGERQLSLINKRSDEGDWGDWSNKLAAQFLSKQSLQLAKRQLGMSIDDKQIEFNECKSLENPTVKKALLATFAEDCDSAAVHLKAAALPRQSYQVILPLTSIKENQVYAPNYRDGEQVALVRYPHGGTFEIPKLTVNNKNQEGKRVLGTNPKDAIGISSKVAERLSGADFDGDTVMVIPISKTTKITSTDPLKDLKGFDSKSYQYDTHTVDSKGVDHYFRNGVEFKTMGKQQTQTQMGVISNLITDMTLRGANESELARAVKHSMVVIDAEKHKLDYKQSEKDNGIAELKKLYQAHVDDDGVTRYGASTLISRSKSKIEVPKTKGSPKILEDGSLSYKLANEYYTDPKTGKEKLRTQSSTRMAEAKDARSLISDYNTPMEQVYATYANKMKAMANEARKEMVATKDIPYSKEAKEKYKKEVDSLNAKLNEAKKNHPRERQAQAIANSKINAYKKTEENYTKADLKKFSNTALMDARAAVGSKRTPVVIEPKEWEAIQAGAISPSKLKAIIGEADTEVLKQMALPKTTTQLSTSKINRIKAYGSRGLSTAEIAKILGISTSTVHKYLTEG